MIKMKTRAYGPIETHEVPKLELSEVMKSLDSQIPKASYHLSSSRHCLYPSFKKIKFFSFLAWVSLTEKIAPPLVGENFVVLELMWNNTVTVNILDDNENFIYAHFSLTNHTTNYRQIDSMTL